MQCSLVKRSDANMWCFVHFDFEMCFAPQRRALFQHLNCQKWREHLVFCTFWLRNVLRATTACTFSTSQLPKVVRTWCVLYILTWKCASRHNGVHFFDISTSKSGPRMVCFVHFDFEMCFAPQRRALFRHLNFQKWSDNGVLYILTWKCDSRHNGVHFFDIATSKSAPKLRCFAHFDLEMCFAPQRRAIFHLSSGQLAPHPLLKRAYFSTLRSPLSLEKHSVSRLSDLFAHLHLLSSYSFSSTLLSSNLSLLSASFLLCFSSVHIVGSLTSKLPSMMFTQFPDQIIYPQVFKEHFRSYLSKHIERLCYYDFS